jgi:hypothetical protein
MAERIQQESGKPCSGTLVKGLPYWDEAMEATGRSLRMLKLEYDEIREHFANEDLGKHLIFLESRLQSGIEIIEEQLAADSGGSGPPTKTSSAQPPKENERPSYLGLVVNKDKQTIQRPGTGHFLELSGNEWTMFKLAFEAGSDGVKEDVWREHHEGEWKGKRESKRQLKEKLGRFGVSLESGRGLRLININKFSRSDGI